jgi:hypothetical protein
MGSFVTLNETFTQVIFRGFREVGELIFEKIPDLRITTTRGSVEKLITAFSHSGRACIYAGVCPEQIANMRVDHVCVFSSETAEVAN